MTTQEAIRNYLRRVAEGGIWDPITKRAACPGCGTPCRSLRSRIDGDIRIRYHKCKCLTCFKSTETSLPERSGGSGFPRE